MTENPYAAPGVPVADSPIDRQSMAKPHQVVMAVRILWASISLGVGFSFFHMVLTDKVTVFGLLGLLLSLFVSGWLYSKISAGRAWARLTLVGFFVAGNAVMWWVLEYSGQPSRWLLIEQLARSCLQLAALYLLFQRPGSEWFRQNIV